MASTIIQRTQTGGDTQKLTMSTWVKRQTLSAYNGLISTYSDDSNRGAIYFQNVNDRFTIYFKNSGSDHIFLETDRVFRDISAWYHIVVSIDTTESTESDRVKLYVNGVRETDFDTETYPSLNSNFSTFHVNGIAAKIGTIQYGSGPTLGIFGGTLAHFHWIDGTAYDASTFGQTDNTTGIWTSKSSPSVTYGTNGFFLKFANSGSMGTDSSGNGNNFTVAAGTLTQTQDTPSNVFCCLNPLTKRDGGTLTNLNTTYEASTADSSVFGTLAVPAGMKVYFEVKLDSNTAQNFLGIHNKYDGGDGAFVKGGSEAGCYGLKVRGSASVVQYFNNGSSTDTAINNYSNGTIIGVAIDNANGQIHYHVNGTYINSSDPSDNNPAALVTGFDTSVEQYLHFSLDTTATQPKNSFNFGNGYFGTTAVSSANSDDAGLGLFEYAPPTGYYSLCTKNINTYG